MKNTIKYYIIMLALLGSCTNDNHEAADKGYTPATTSTNTLPASPPANFKHQSAEVNGVRIHYVTGGTGAPLVLVHGFGENWHSWNRILPELSKHFTVIVPDLRGIGESDKPKTGYDKKNMAKDIHELVQKLGYKSISIAGHDVGLMVAYAYAAQYGNEVRKVALLEAVLPGIDPYWSQVKAEAWWFGFFNWPISPELVKGKERLFFTQFQNDKSHKKDVFTKEERDEVMRIYSMPGALTSSFQWYATFAQDAVDNKEFMKHKLAMPVLVLAGEFAAGAGLGDQIKLVATDVQAIEMKGVKHWLVQEKTEDVQQQLLDFFMKQ